MNDPTYKNTDIAVIGMACRFPGSESVEAFWDNLKNGKETISHFSDDELKQFDIEETLLKKRNYVKSSGKISGAEFFDASFFGFSPYEASVTDPQHRLMFELAWEALEISGYANKRYRESVGVFVGMGQSHYERDFLLKNAEFSESYDAYHSAITTGEAFLASKISYLLDLNGPSVTLNTACSTSLASIVLGVQSLLAGKCQIVLAGGVSVTFPQESGYFYKEGSIFSPDGHCRAFDANAKGTIKSNGVGLVVLKKLCDAVRDGDAIDAIIKGHGINNDGSQKMGYTAPSITGQEQCILMALKDSGINPETIGYIEAHGTGTQMGDPIEVAAITNAFRHFTNKKQYCAIGSVKTNIGHTDTAAGVAGFIKAVLTVKHGCVPANIHFVKQNPQILFSETPFYVNNELKSWPLIDGPKRAGVSSFGMGGTNVHVLIEESPARLSVSSSRPIKMLMFSGKTEGALDDYCAKFYDFLKNNQESLSNEDFSDVAYTLQTGREDFPHRCFIVGREASETIDLIETKSLRKSFIDEGSVKSTVAFVFSGQGSQYINMGSELYSKEPLFKKTIDFCFELARKYSKHNLKNILYPPVTAELSEVKKRLVNTKFTQPILFITQYALAKLLISWGVKPEVVIGHSLGEYVAAAISGVFSLEDAIMLVIRRAEMMSKLKKGRMLAVGLEESKIQEMLFDGVSLAAVNAPSLCVVSGASLNIKKFKDELLHKHPNVLCKYINVSHAMHSNMVEEMLPSFLSVLKNVSYNAPNISFISTCTGGKISSELCDPSYWLMQMRRPVRFQKAIEELVDLGGHIFLEIGPGKTLTNFINQKSRHNQTIAFNTLPIEKNCNKSLYVDLLSSLGELWLNGIKIDWISFYKDEFRRKRKIPTYQFQKEYYFIKPDKVFNAPLGHKKNSTSKSNHLYVYTPFWKSEINPYKGKSTRGVEKKQSWLIFLDTFGFGKEIGEWLEKKNHVVYVDQGSSFSRISENHYQIDVKREDDYEKLHDQLSLTQFTVDHIIHLSSLTKADDMNKELSDFYQDVGFFSLTYISQIFLRKSKPSIQLIVVSNYIKKVLSSDMIVSDKATLLGACDTIPHEYSGASTMYIDIQIPKTLCERQEVLSQLYERIISDESQENFSLVTAMRNGCWWNEGYSLRHENDHTNVNHLIRKNGIYLITGGLGKIGMEIALFLAKENKITLFFLSRNFPISTADSSKYDKRHEKLNELKCLGADYYILQGDLTNEKWLKSSIEKIQDKFGPLNGIIHAAGITGSQALCPIKDVSPTFAWQQFSVKITALKNIYKFSNKTNLDFVILCSSLATLIGGKGFSTYSAANHFLNGFANQYQIENSRTDFFSINWDTWEEAEKLDDKYSNCIRKINARSGMEILEKILQLKISPQVFVTASDLNLKIQYSNECREKLAENDNLVKNIQPIAFKSNSTSSSLIDFEQKVSNIFEECLGLKNIKKDSDFYDLGGHSLISLRLTSMLEKEFQVEITQNEFNSARTIRKTVELLKNKIAAIDTSSSVVRFNSTSKSTPLFLLPPVDGTLTSYFNLIKCLPEDQFICGLQDPTAFLKTASYDDFEAMAGYYLDLIKKEQAEGPYRLLGYSLGGNLAFEIARQLISENKKVSFIGLIDSWAFFSEELRNRDIFKNSMEIKLSDLGEKFQEKSLSFEKYINMIWRRMELLCNYTPKFLDTKVVLFKAKELLPEYKTVDDPFNHWISYVKEIYIESITGNHDSIFKIQNIQELSEKVTKHLHGLELQPSSQESNL